MKQLFAAGRAAKPQGLVDILPGAAGERRRLEQTILDTFGGWGYELIATPSIELLSTVELGVQPEQARRLFKLADNDGQMVALVSERTVSVARVAAGQLQNAPRPLRLSYTGPTFMGHPPTGVRREGHQTGAELIGEHSAAADAEVVAMAIQALLACGLRDFQAEVGHIDFFGGVMSRLAPQQAIQVRDALTGRDLVELEQALAETDLAAAERQLLLRFPALRGGSDILEAAAPLVQDGASAIAIDELRQVYSRLQEHGVADRVNLDLGAVRDFDYYTGIIFEVFARGQGAPIAAGGRYDGLLRKFGKDEPATGVVIFLDRLQQTVGSAL